MSFVTHAATVTGTAVDHLTGQALAHTQVTLSGGADHSQQQTFTDRSGQFRFVIVKAGAYQLSAQRKGYVLARYGQSTWDGPGTYVALEENSGFAAEVRLHRLGVIQGFVRDENGIGLPEVSVYAYRVRQRLRVGGAAITDDRGAFRVRNLEPGQYAVRSGPIELEDRQGLLPTYAGNATRLGEAQTFRVEPDREVGPVEVAPLAGRLVKLSVSVQNGPGSAKVTLFTDGGKQEGRAAAGSPAQFDRLPPGAFTILAEETSGSDHWAAYRRVVLGKEAESVTMDLEPATALKLKCESRDANKLELIGATAFLRRVEYAEDPQPARLNCGEQLTLGPGEWEVGALAPAGNYLAHVSGAEAGPDAFRITLAGRAKELTLYFAKDGCDLDGSVITGDGAAAVGAYVFLRSPDADLLDRIGGIRQARTDLGGKYRFIGLPPGVYEAVVSAAARDAADLTWAPQTSKRIALEAGKQLTVDLDLPASN